MLDYGFENGIDFTEFRPLKNEPSENSGVDQRFVKEKIDHQLTLDMAKEISMIQRNAKGKEARLYFIECERLLKDQVPSYQIDNPIERAKVWINEQKEKQKLIEQTTALKNENVIVWKTRGQISRSREAQVMGKLGAAVRENYKLKVENTSLKENNHITPDIKKKGEYTSTEIGQLYGILSVNNKPHARLITALLTPLDLFYTPNLPELYDGIYYRETYTIVGDKEYKTLLYKTSVLKEMDNILNNYLFQNEYEIFYDKYGKIKEKYRAIEINNTFYKYKLTPDLIQDLENIITE